MFIHDRTDENWGSTTFEIGVQHKMPVPVLMPENAFWEPVHKLPFAVWLLLSGLAPILLWKLWNKHK